ncbi:hypothetical protein quinque_014494 [Culex quinquefasciatus]
MLDELGDDDEHPMSGRVNNKARIHRQRDETCREAGKTGPVNVCYDDGKGEKSKQRESLGEICIRWRARWSCRSGELYLCRTYNLVATETSQRKHEIMSPPPRAAGKHTSDDDDDGYSGF